jgi:hypothetical protein
VRRERGARVEGVDRAGFLSLGARTGVAVALGAAGVTVLSESVPAAFGATGPLTEFDLAVARLAVGAEILAAAFYSQAIDSNQFKGDELKYLKRALFNEQEHLATMSQIIAGAGQTPSTSDDFTITFPDGSFASRESAARLGAVLETAFVSTYLGAVDEFAPPDLKSTAARIAANESEHWSVLSDLAFGRPIGNSFPAPIDYVTASAVLEPFLS